jgi:hypothetical protein
MVQELKQYFQPLVSGELSVEVAICLFRVGKTAELLYRFLHIQIIAPLQMFPSAFQQPL